jgi:tRNA 2-thiouridine synthesizing protein A
LNAIEGDDFMATHTLDAKGMRCPQPVIRMTALVPTIAPGDILEVTADCDSFEDDVTKWCARWSRTLLAVTPDGGAVRAQIMF